MTWDSQRKFETPRLRSCFDKTVGGQTVQTVGRTKANEGNCFTLIQGPDFLIFTIMM